MANINLTKLQNGNTNNVGSNWGNNLHIINATDRSGGSKEINSKEIYSEPKKLNENNTNNPSVLVTDLSGNVDNRGSVAKVYGQKEIIISGETLKGPVFKSWKGEQAQEMLNVMWRVSGGNKEFILTMLAENGTFDAFRKHPVRNRDKSWDYSFGLNSYYHKPMIDKIMAKTVSLEEIAQYHLDIYNRPDWKTSCGKKAFCGYKRISKADVKNQIIFN